MSLSSSVVLRCLRSCLCVDICRMCCQHTFCGLMDTGGDFQLWVDPACGASTRWMETLKCCSYLGQCATHCVPHTVHLTTTTDSHKNVRQLQDDKHLTTLGLHWVGSKQEVWWCIKINFLMWSATEIEYLLNASGFIFSEFVHSFLKFKGQSHRLLFTQDESTWINGDDGLQNIKRLGVLHVVV